MNRPIPIRLPGQLSTEPSAGRFERALPSQRAVVDSHEDAASRERRLVAFALAGILASFTLFAAHFARRVINNLWGDLSFSGWGGPVGHQLVEGRTLFGDLVLPLPPGSFVIMAWIERVLGDGAPRLLHENWVCAVSYMLMALFGYAIARPLAGPRVALFTAAGTLGWVSIWIKELAYDPLAEVWAWAAVAALVQAWVRKPGPVERRWLLGAGLLTGATLFFKQSTATGLLGGALVGFGYLALVERRMQGAARARAHGVWAYGGGVLAGVAGCIAGVVATGGSIPTFLAAVFVDGSALKGGTGELALRTVWHSIAQPMSVFSLVTLALIGGLVVRIARHPVGFTLGETRRALRPRDVTGVVLLSALVFGVGALLLAARLQDLVLPLVPVLVLSVFVVQLAVCMTVAVFFVNHGPPTPARQGRAFNAAVLATLVLGCTVSMSMTALNPVYENNALIAVALAALFSALDRSRVRGLAWIILALAVAMPLGWRVPRAAAAVHPAPDDSFFRGMTVNDAGLDVLRAAALARDVAGPDGRVLVLPEDPSFLALTGRSRPALCGAIVFTDQYPRRCLEPDLERLQRDPPEVLVLRPVEPAAMLAHVRTWKEGTPTEELITRFLQARLDRYEPVKSFRTRLATSSVSLGIWRLRSRGDT